MVLPSLPLGLLLIANAPPVEPLPEPERAEMPSEQNPIGTQASAVEKFKKLKVQVFSPSSTKQVIQLLHSLPEGSFENEDFELNLQVSRLSNVSLSQNLPLYLRYQLKTELSKALVQSMNATKSIEHRQTLEGTLFSIIHTSGELPLSPQERIQVFDKVRLATGRIIDRFINNLENYTRDQYSPPPVGYTREQLQSILWYLTKNFEYFSKPLKKRIQSLAANTQLKRLIENDDQLLQEFSSLVNTKQRCSDFLKKRLFKRASSS